MVVVGRDVPASGYALEVDGRLKAEFATRDGAKAGAEELQKRFPKLRVRLCSDKDSRGDPASGSIGAVGLPCACGGSTATRAREMNGARSQSSGFRCQRPTMSSSAGRDWKPGETRSPYGRDRSLGRPSGVQILTSLRARSLTLNSAGPRFEPWPTTRNQAKSVSSGDFRVKSEAFQKRQIAIWVRFWVHVVR